jgi:hypothetical protein
MSKLVEIVLVFDDGSKMTVGMPTSQTSVATAAPEQLPAPALAPAPAPEPVPAKPMLWTPPDGKTFTTAALKDIITTWLSVNGVAYADLVAGGNLAGLTNPDNWARRNKCRTGSLKRLDPSRLAPNPQNWAMHHAAIYDQNPSTSVTTDDVPNCIYRSFQTKPDGSAPATEAHVITTPDDDVLLMLVVEPL